MMLSRNCISEMQCSVVKEKYLKRAEQEWNTRKITLGSTLERRDYEPKYIVEDVEKQLLRYQQADSGEDAELKKFINDFHSLYLNRKVQYDPKTVACGASLVRLMYELMISGMGWDKVKQALEIEKKLGMEHLSGPEKGQKIRKLRNQLDVYKRQIPHRLDAVVLSTQHDPDVTQEQIHEDIKKYVLEPIIPTELVDENTKFFINPTGRFVIGGPHGDSGVTGRKIIVDTYGGMARHRCV